LRRKRFSIFRGEAPKGHSKKGKAGGKYALFALNACSKVRGTDDSGRKWFNSERISGGDMVGAWRRNTGVKKFRQKKNLLSPHAASGSWGRVPPPQDKKGERKLKGQGLGHGGRHGKVRASSAWGRQRRHSAEFRELWRWTMEVPRKVERKI